MGKREFNYDAASLKKHYWPSCFIDTQSTLLQHLTRAVSECILLMSVSAHITRQNKKIIIGFKFIKYLYSLCTIIYMLAYNLYFTLERKMIIVGLHIITSMRTKHNLIIYYTGYIRYAFYRSYIDLMLV